jgi:hypothetical protein
VGVVAAITVSPSVRDTAGNAYFYNSVTGESSWELPPAVQGTHTLLQQLNDALAAGGVDAIPVLPKTDLDALVHAFAVRRVERVCVGRVRALVASVRCAMVMAMAMQRR